jgi:hypothetical protein
MCSVGSSTTIVAAVVRHVTANSRCRAPPSTAAMRIPSAPTPAPNAHGVSSAQKHVVSRIQNYAFGRLSVVPAAHRRAAEWDAARMALVTTAGAGGRLVARATRPYSCRCAVRIIGAPSYNPRSILIRFLTLSGSGNPCFPGPTRTRCGSAGKRLCDSHSLSLSLSLCVFFLAVWGSYLATVTAWNSTDLTYGKFWDAYTQGPDILEFRLGSRPWGHHHTSLAHPPRCLVRCV